MSPLSGGLSGGLTGGLTGGLIGNGSATTTSVQP